MGLPWFIRIFAHIHSLTVGFLFRSDDLGLLVAKWKVGQVHSFSVNITALGNNNYIYVHIKDSL
jgi:hypothetical protein